MTDSPGPWRARVHRVRQMLRPSSARGRVLVAAVALLATSSIAGVVAVRIVLIARLEERVDRELRQEADEFRTLLGGTNPETGAPFGDDVASLFDVFLARNVPGDDEVLFTIVEEAPYRRSADAPYPLEDLDDVVGRWVDTPVAVIETLPTPVGSIRSLAVPVVSGNRRLGTFVAARFTVPERRRVNDTVRSFGVVTAATFLAASAAAWAVAGRVLAPLRALATTAASIGRNDLTRRIDVSGSGELAVLTETFNRMLDRLEGAIDAQRSFLDDAGHELRTPLTIVRGHLELTAAGAPLDESTRGLLLDEVDRMARIVDDLLVLAKAEQPDFVVLAPVDVADLVHDVVAKSVALGPRDWVVESAAEVVAPLDRQRMTQALVNLTRNAYQHSSKGSTIAVGAVVRGDSIELTVRDEGEGIALEDQARIFDRFARVGAVGRGRADGLGLGLSITAAIVHAHGGSIAVRSEPGQGAEFRLNLPLTSDGDA